MKILKLSGLIVALSLIIAAVAGSSASAYFQSESQQTNWSIGGSAKFDFGYIAMACDNATLAGQSSTQTTEILTTTPQLAGCSALGVSGFKWAMNGCKFRLRLTNVSPQVGKLSIVNCESPMRVSLNSAGQNCTLEIGNQGGLGSITYSTIGTGSSRVVEASLNIQGLTFTRSGNWCGPAGTFEDGALGGTWVMQGTNAGTGTKTGVWVEGNKAPAPEPAFWAEEAPVTLGGSQIESQVFAVAGNTLKCKAISYSGKSASLTTQDLTVVPVLSGCTFFGVNTTVSTGGCEFRFQTNNTLAIAGTSCSSTPIQFTATVLGAKCTVTIGPQALGGVSYANSGPGVVVTPEITNLTYTANGALCGKTSAGTYTGKSKLTATNSAAKAQALWIE